MSTVIKAKALSKWFGEAVAVNNMDLDIGAGVTGLLGPNGAGKSTLIKLCLGLYKPSHGYLHVFGRPPRNNLHVLRRMGYCPEIDSFYESMSGYEFLYWLNRFWGMASKDAANRAEQACETVNMTERMHDPIEQYSRGMRQRIKIAQALVTEPELLFLDEPMAGLDPKGREEMFELIRTLGERGRTVIVSSHVLYEIERVTSNIVLLHNGCILAHGSVRHIRGLLAEHPRTITVESPEARKIAARFIDDAATLDVRFKDGAVTFRTKNLEGFYDKLNGMIVENGEPVTSIHCIDEDLQSIFDYLVK